MKNIKTLSILLCLSFTIITTQAATIAVIDSGTDTDHPGLAGHIWHNSKDPVDGVDNNGDGKVDDYLGWNFLAKNNKIFDSKYNSLLADSNVRKYFDLKIKYYDGTLTPSEKSWLQMAKFNRPLMGKIGSAGTHLHGTHVAGISTIGTKFSKVMTIKLLTIKAKTIFSTTMEKGSRDPYRPVRSKFGELKKQLTLMASRSTSNFSGISMYINRKASIANCSFGTGYKRISKIVPMMFKKFYKKEPTKDEARKLTLHFMNATLRLGKQIVDQARETLFVIASGNDGMNNDVYPSFPANIQSSHVITVAATYGRSRIAKFSNYGSTSVDIAAPGVNIRSTAPGGRYISVSGTSQAAPYISKVAARIKEINPYLSARRVRWILMGTVDKKEWLKDMVLSEGIVNENRAIWAAQLTKKYEIRKAIKIAQEQTPDIPVDDNGSEKGLDDDDLFIPELPLPSPIDFSM